MRKPILSAVSVLLCILLIAGCAGNKPTDNNSSSMTDVSSDILSSEEDTSSDDSTASSDDGVSSENDTSYNAYTSSTEDNSADDNTVSSNDSDITSSGDDVSSDTTSDNKEDNQSQSKDDNSLMKNEIIPEGNTSILMQDVKGGADKEADALRNKILNTKDSLKISGTTYYVSSKTGDDDNDGLTPETAWATTDAITLNSYLFKEGDAVLFERGCVFRTTSQIFCKTGVTYGAYGEGDKPIIYGSVRNYSYPGLWKPSTKKNVWKMTLTLEDAGIIVFDHGKAAGDKKNGLLAVTENYDFYHNVSESVLYLYLDKGRPNQVFDDIEIGTRRAIFTLASGVTDVRIDNICMKYAGNFAVQCISDQENVQITNCEIGWIGGCYMQDGKQERYGNGIQFWYDASNCLIDNCWVYQIYDAGVTFQGPGDAVYENVDFTNNLIEYTCMAIEFWIGGESYGRPLTGYVEDCDFIGNILRFSGYEWSTDMRPNPIQTSFLQGGNGSGYDIRSMTVKNNIFDKSTYYIFKWSGSDLSNVTIEGNTYYGQKSMVRDSMLCHKDRYGSDVVNVTDLTSLKKAVMEIDSNPKKIAWLD